MCICVYVCVCVCVCVYVCVCVVFANNLVCPRMQRSRVSMSMLNFYMYMHAYYVMYACRDNMHF